MNVNTGTCLYCGTETPEPPCKCPGCERGLTLAISGETTLQEIGTALALNGFKTAVKLELDILSVTIDE